MPARSKMAALVVQAAKNGSTTAPRERLPPPRDAPKARPPLRATARHPAKPASGPASQDSVSGIWQAVPTSNAGYSAPDSSAHSASQK